MRVWQFEDGGGDVRLRMVSEAVPEPGPTEALVRVRAVALNFRDLVVARGGYQGRVPVGAVPCSDGAGEVVAVGGAVSGVAVGDRVTSTFAPNWLTGTLTREALRTTLGGGLAAGMLAEHVVLPAASLVAMPEGWNRGTRRWISTRW
jgi:NADPH:quinone reductase-like Zn-dependent oxidoreductase